MISYKEISKLLPSSAHSVSGLQVQPSSTLLLKSDTDSSQLVDTVFVKSTKLNTIKTSDGWVWQASELGLVAQHMLGGNVLYS